MSRRLIMFIAVEMIRNDLTYLKARPELPSCPLCYKHYVPMAQLRK
jgi:hypothetical protein